MHAATTTTNQADTHPPRWVTSAVLVAMAARRMGQGSRFTSADLRGWVPKLGSEQQRNQAAKMLVRAGFVRSQVCMTEAMVQYTTYTITAAGAAAIQAAAGGQRLTSGPKGPQAQGRAVKQGTFAARLWALLRARKVLDSDTAASTLVDADAAPQVRVTAQDTARCYLMRWARTGAVVESRAREANGCKRYVLVQDSPQPPRWTRAGKQEVCA